MRIAIGNYNGLTAEELVERDPGYAEWFSQHADRAPMELRQEVRAVLAESRLARLSDQYDRLSQKMEGMKRQHAENRIRTPSAEEINVEKVRADELQRELADAYRVMADKDQELDTIKETFTKLRAEYVRMVCPSGGGSGSSSAAGS